MRRCSFGASAGGERAISSSSTSASCPSAGFEVAWARRRREGEEEPHRLRPAAAQARRRAARVAQDACALGGHRGRPALHASARWPPRLRASTSRRGWSRLPRFARSAARGPARAAGGRGLRRHASASSFTYPRRSARASCTAAIRLSGMLAEGCSKRASRRPASRSNLQPCRARPRGAWPRGLLGHDGSEQTDHRAAPAAAASARIATPRAAPTRCWSRRRLRWRCRQDGSRLPRAPRRSHWLAAPAAEDSPIGSRRESVERALADWLDSGSQCSSTSRASVPRRLLADHLRVREAADPEARRGRRRGQTTVTPLLPVDVIGVFVLMPALGF